MRLSVRSLRPLVRQLRPAYVVHPKVETVEADVQGYNWTGCRVVEGRPSSVRDKEAEVDMTLFTRDVVRSIMVARDFESQEEGRTPRAYPTSLFHHLLLAVFSHTPSYPQLRDLHLAHG